MVARPLSGLVITALLVAQSGCGSSGSSQLLNAALNVGVAAAAVAVAAATAPNTCSGGCRQGTVCNEQLNLCEPLPCHARCLSDDECVMLYGKETCMPRSRLDEFATAPEGAAPPAPAPAVEGVADDPCGGLCFRGETCRVKGGVADCVAAPP